MLPLCMIFERYLLSDLRACAYFGAYQATTSSRFVRAKHALGICFDEGDQRVFANLVSDTPLFPRENKYQYQLLDAVLREELRPHLPGLEATPADTRLKDHGRLHLYIASLNPREKIPDVMVLSTFRPPRPYELLNVPFHCSSPVEPPEGVIAYLSRKITR
jgi:hypothetical protein